ncbi:unnamed protein product [Rotaria sp. Silwood2]|nr:unnamed protein product [Rotaria sp. Silwood2]CAF4256400.1 unnamed protein product [Rotaria sp. Silwood2]
MNESANERSSISSDIGEVEILNDDMELEDQRFRFIITYLNIVYGTTPIAFKKAIINNEVNRKVIESFFQLIIRFSNKRIFRPSNVLLLIISEDKTCLS